jgi:cytochrome P450
MITILLSILIVLISICVALHLIEVYKYRHIPGVNQLLPLSLIRIPFFAPYLYLNNWSTAQQLRRRFQKHGIYRVTAFTKTYITCFSIEAARHVLVKNCNNYQKPTSMYKSIDIFGKNIVSAPGGEEHRKHRRVVEPAFEEKHLRYLIEVTNESTDLLIQHLLNKDNIMDVNLDMIELTMDIIGKSAFGYNLNIFSDMENAKHTVFDQSKHSMSFYDALDITNGKGLLVANFVPKVIRFLPFFKKVDQAIAETRKYIVELVQERKGSDEPRLDLLSLLVQSNDNPTAESKLTMEEIVSDAFIFLLAGHETTATSMGWLLYEVAKHREVQNKIHQELDTVLDGREVTYDDIPNLKYMNNCIKETLRLHSPVNSVPKTNKKKDVLCGFTVPKNSAIMVHFRHIHQNCWDNSNEFIPERFDQKYDSVSFLSFSYGTRKCVGFNFSLLETAAILSKIMQRYEICFQEHIDPETFTPKTEGFITLKVSDLHLKLQPRK